MNDNFKLTDDKCSVYTITCLTSGTYFTDKEHISPGEEQISQIQNLFHQVRNKSHKPGTYFTSGKEQISQTQNLFHQVQCGTYFIEMEQIIWKLSVEKVLPEQISCEISSTGTFFTGTNFGSNIHIHL